MTEEYKYESPEEQLDRQLKELAHHREQIGIAKKGLTGDKAPPGVQQYNSEKFSRHTFLVSVPPEEYLAQVGTLAEESFEAFFHQLFLETDLEEAKIKADYKKRKAWQKIGEMIGVSDEELRNPNTPHYEMAWDDEAEKVMFFSKPPEPSTEEILRALGIGD